MGFAEILNVQWKTGSPGMDRTCALKINSFVPYRLATGELDYYYKRYLRIDLVDEEISIVDIKSDVTSSMSVVSLAMRQSEPNLSCVSQL